MTTIVAPPWEEQRTEGGITDAPTDGKTYGRKDAAWAEVVSAATAGDIVAASALPLPDVWAPLSDSLRLITGYGRDVLVGSDVVARMVNFSRNSTATYIGKDGLLKTAAANEPLFEKEGLLLDGQSTNLNPRSQQFNWMDGYGASPAVQSPNTDPQTSSLITTIDVTAGRRRPFIAGILTVGKTYTISFRAKSDGGVISQVSSQLTGAVYPAVAPGEWKTYSFTGVATSSAADFQITGTSVSIAWIQVEELPFASHYIPTNGAAVTRAADAATLPQSLNLGESQVGFSLAVEFASVNPGSYRVLELSDFSSILADGASIIIRHAGKEVYGINAPLGQRHHIAYSVATDGVITVALNGKVLATQSRSAGAASSKTSISLGNRWNGDNNRAIYGHLRDLKIWTKKPLTADQLKVASA